MVSIIMPMYNRADVVAESIESAIGQDCEKKEIIIYDNASTDGTWEIAREYENFPKVKVYKNEKNTGLGGVLTQLVSKARGDYIVILCHDDIFTNPHVVSDMVRIFEADEKIGLIGRYYYQYLNGYPGAVMTIRGDIFMSSCQPSGIGFRKSAIQGDFTNKLFIEIPDMAKKIISSDWRYTIIEYDTIAARLMPNEKGNAAAQPGYYKTDPPQSPILNWYGVLGEPLCLYTGFIQLKNRSPWLLFSEIKTLVKIKPGVLLNIGFWFCVIVAVITPGWILRRLSNFYRHRITRRFCKIIRRSK